MSDARKQVLEMLAEGKVTREDALRLLDALGESNPGGEISEMTDMPDASPVKEAEEQPAPEAPAGEGFGEGIAGAVADRLTAMFGDEARFKEKMEEVAETAEVLAGRAGELARKAAEGAAEMAEAAVISFEAEFDRPEEKGTADLRKQGEAYCAKIAGEILDELEIDWINGPIELRYGEELRVTEYANRTLADDERMEAELKNGRLKIGWSGKKLLRFRGLKAMRLRKHLVVELPADTKFTEVEIKTANGGVIAPRICSDKLELHSTGGSVNIEELTGDDIEVSTASGSIKVKAVSGDVLDLKSVSGSITCGAVQGDEVDISTVSGSIRAEKVSGDMLDLKSVSGSIACRAVLGDEIDVTSASGSIRAENIQGSRVDLATTSGSITAAAAAEEELMGESSSGSVSITLTAPAEKVRLSTTSGRSRLTLPANTEGFRVCYETASGSFHCDFPLTGRLEKRSGEAAFGTEAMELKLSSGSGNIELKKQ